MKMNLKWLGIGSVLGAAMLFAMDLPANDFDLADDLLESCMASVKKDCQKWAAKGGGSEAPRGLKSESKAELALGERYILTGTIVISGDYAFLKISFSDHPWLRSRSRADNPYYRIYDSKQKWKRYEGQKLNIVAVARYTAWNQDGKIRIEILLEPSPDSVIDAIQSKSRK